MLLWSQGRCVASLALGCALASCSVYDPELIKEKGAVTTGGLGGTSGRGGTGGTGGGGSGGSGGSAPPPASCGDGEVALDERCDIAIADGMPGACPKTCPPLVNCVPRMLNDSNCQSYCAELHQPCQDGDGCCPASCNNATDDDCSKSCGDGVLQEGETCEPDADAGVPCIEEDECVATEMCQKAVYVGSPDNCNASCTITEITTVAPGDKCCPLDANANLDSDCMPRCGNAAREGTEECDGGEGCTPDCMLLSTVAKMHCLSLLPENANDCDRCSCMQCTTQQLNCRESGDATRDMHCTIVNQCANDNNCARTSCYCANPPSTDPLCLAPGPCVMQIDAAVASSPSLGNVIQQRDNPDAAIGRSALISDCNAMNCREVCP